jgi:hypothetical protein
MIKLTFYIGVIFLIEERKPAELIASTEFDILIFIINRRLGIKKNPISLKWDSKFIIRLQLQLATGFGF